MKTISSLNFSVLCSELKTHFFDKHKIALKTPCNTLSIFARYRYGYIMEIEHSDYNFTNRQLRELQIIINKNK